MTTEHHLSLRPTGKNDYSVMRERRPIGRIRLADDRPEQETWSWSITVPLPIPAFGVGRAPSMEAAKTAFRTAWGKFYDALSRMTSGTGSIIRTPHGSGRSGSDGLSGNAGNG